ncbi:MAG: hypothetical protein NXI22_09880 [bacterium]|nr:hypothetical protein [bacterium]
MTESNRSQRLESDYAALKGLRKVSSIFDFEADSTRPERYLLKFHGRGLAPIASRPGDAEIIEEHHVELRLAQAYPARPPQVRWLTPILHPNISFGGFIQFRELGLVWQPELSLDIVAEHLWDLARLAYVRPTEATNAVAAKFLEETNTYRVPIDARPLRDKQKPSSGNIIRYGPRGNTKTPAVESLPPGKDVLVIDEDSVAEIASIVEPPAADPPPRVPPRRSSDDDILYIND